MRVACAGGGTLGSVSPLLAVLEELALGGGELRVHWFGTEQGPERELVEAAGYTFYALPAGKLRRYWSLANLVDLGRTAVGFLRALWWFTQHRVDVLLTAGSFVAVPVGWAAWLTGVPVMVHQQDVRPGLANRLLAPFARRITVALEQSRRDFSPPKTVCTGNPVRRAFAAPPEQAAARQRLGLEPGVPTLVVTGGGTGAELLNQIVARARCELTAAAQVVHLTGPGRGGSVTAGLRYHALPFTHDTVAVFSAADLVVTRAGLGTLTELAALGRPALVVPIPGTHQEDNARLLAGCGAAYVLEQARLTPEVLVGTVRQLLHDHPARERLASALARLLPPDAASRVAREVRAVCGYA